MRFRRARVPASMAVHVWHLVVPREKQAETEAWLIEGRLVAEGVGLPRKGDVVYVRDRHKGAFLVGRVLEDARFAEEGKVEAKVRWARIEDPLVLAGAPRGEGLRRMHGHSWEHRIEAKRWLGDDEP